MRNKRGLDVEKSGGERIALFDNIKGILIILVVLGHIAHPIHNENPVLSAVFDTIYLFHMPLFVFMSGLFAKGAYRGGKLNVDRILSFLVLGFGFQIALALVNGAALTPARILSFTSAPWYLVSMACWYALTPALSHLGPQRGLALALAIAAIRVIDPDAHEWFFPMVYGDNPYEHGLLMGALQKLTALGIGALFSVALIRLAPERRGTLTTLGRRTLQVYVLHRLIRAWLTFHTPLYDFPWMIEAVPGALAVTAVAAAVTLACAAPVFERPFARLLKIHWTRAFVRPMRAGR